MYAGVDVGASKTIVAVESLNGDTSQQRFETPKDINYFFTTVISTTQYLLDEHELHGWVIAAPGIIDNGRLVRGGNIRWQDADLATHLASAFPDAPIEILNDAAAAGWYEANHGHARGATTVLYITLSTGIGTSIIVNGELLPPSGNSEGGQMIYNAEREQRFEEAASGQYFTRTYHRQGKDVDDPRIWHDYATSVAPGLFSMIALLQPSTVVIGGSMGTYFAQYQDSLSQQLRSLSRDMFELPHLTAASQPEMAVIAGCLARARRLSDHA